MKSRILALLGCLVVLVAAGAGAYFIYTIYENRVIVTIDDSSPLIFPSQTEYIQTEPETEGPTVPSPKIDEQYLTINKWSRPGDKITEVKNIVVHYLGNPRTTAQENRDYFESLKDLQNESMSSNYVVGLDGEIIHCVPDDEVAYASNSANKTSISVENCHLNDKGKLQKETYLSLVRLVAYLTVQYDLEKDDIIRHYDVTGKECPLFYVENPKLWDRFKNDVWTYRTKCLEEAADAQDLESYLTGLEYTYQNREEAQADTEKQTEPPTEKAEEASSHNHEESVPEEEYYEEAPQEEEYYEEPYYEEEYYEEAYYEEPYYDEFYDDGSWDTPPDFYE